MEKFARFIEETGIKRFINFSDNEPSILALKDAAARSLPFVESTPESCPVSDHQSHGSIEVRVRELKRQMRADRMQYERRLGIVLAKDDPILSWIPTFAGGVISLYGRGADGKTPWEREAGRKWSLQSLEFGERVKVGCCPKRFPENKRWSARGWLE